MFEDNQNPEDYSIDIEIPEKEPIFAEEKNVAQIPYEFLGNESPWKAFTYMFKTKSVWLFGLMSAFAYIVNTLKSYKDVESFSLSIVLLIICFKIFVQPFIFGYSFSLTKALSVQEKEHSAPKFDWWESLVYSFKFIVGIIVLSCILVVPVIIVFLIPIANVIIGILATVFFFFILPAIIWYFSHTKHITSFIKFKTILGLISRNMKRYLTVTAANVFFYVVLCTVVFNIYSHYKEEVFSQILNKNVVMINSIEPIIVVAIISIYVSLISPFLNAKCIHPKEIEFLNKN